MGNRQQSLLTLPYMDLMLERAARTRKRFTWKSPTGWAQRWHAGAEGSLAQIGEVSTFVHQVPSNGEEHEEDSDNGPKIDAGH